MKSTDYTDFTLADWNKEINEGPDANDGDLMDEDIIDLIPCPNCGAMISEYAQQCPECGDWVVERSTHSAWADKSLWWILLALGGAVMFVLIYAF